MMDYKIDHLNIKFNWLFSSLMELEMENFYCWSIKRRFIRIKNDNVYYQWEKNKTLFQKLKIIVKI